MQVSLDHVLDDAVMHEYWEVCVWTSPADDAYPIVNIFTTEWEASSQYRDIISELSQYGVKCAMVNHLEIDARQRRIINNLSYMNIEDK